MKSNAVIFIGQAFGTGIYRHLALLGVELSKVAPSGVDFYFASVLREANQGAWQIVRNALSPRNIICESSFSKLAHKCVELSVSYPSVIIHTGGGWGQTKHFLSSIYQIKKEFRKHVQFVATTHSFRNESFLRIPMSVIQNIFYRIFYSKVVFQCQYAANRFVGGNSLIRKGKACIIPLGCEHFDFSSAEPPSGIRAISSLFSLLNDNNLFKFVYLAGFRPGKMHAWLVRSMAPFLKNNPNVRILFCGKGSQRIVNSVVFEIIKWKLENQIILTGQIPRVDIPWLLMHCDCAIVSSKSETFGHCFIEPMFAGLPVLGTRVGIGCDVIRDGETGYAFDLSRPSSLIKGAEKMLSLSNHGGIKEMGCRARDLVEKRFSHTVVAKQLMNLYFSLLNKQDGY